MSALHAVEIVLAEAGSPLHYHEITERLLRRGLWQSDGKTPEATINARLAVDIKKNGSHSVFQRTGPGVFALRAWGLPEVEPKNKISSSSATLSVVIDQAPVNQDGQQPAPPVSSVGKSKQQEKEQMPQNLSFTEAAEYVLQHFADKKPMHYRVITDKVLELGLVQTQGLTPEATLYAQILTEIKRLTQRGESPHFVKHGKGFVGLSKWMGDGLAFQIHEHNKAIRQKLKKRLHQMDPADFEALIGKLLVALGFDEVEVTRVSNDGGIDVRGTLVVGDVISTHMAVQVKRWKNNVQAPTVQQVHGSLRAQEKGLIITTSGFSAGASKEASRDGAVPVGLMDGEQLVTLLLENEIGVTRTSYNLFELADEQAEE